MAVLLAAANGDSKFRQSIAVHLLKLRKQGARHGMANIPCSRSTAAQPQTGDGSPRSSHAGEEDTPKKSLSHVVHTHTLSHFPRRTPARGKSRPGKPAKNPSERGQNRTPDRRAREWTPAPDAQRQSSPSGSVSFPVPVEIDRPPEGIE
jgi:hypothetical protein